MTTLILELDPVALNIEINHVDGRSLGIPLAWYPRLLHGAPQERKNWQLLGDGYAIEWPDLDEHIGIEGLLAGRRSGESRHSFERWLANRKGSKDISITFSES